MYTTEEYIRRPPTTAIIMVNSEWLSGQWALLVVACAALLLLMFLLSFRNESRGKETTGTPRKETVG